MKKYACVLVILQIMLMFNVAYADSHMDQSRDVIDESTINVDTPWLYTVQHKDFVPELLCSTLLGLDYQYERTDAYGIWYTNRRDSYVSMLGLFDPGNATPSGSGLDGGFAYLIMRDGISYYEILGSVLDLQPGYQHTNQWAGNANVELPFCDIDNVISSIDQIMRQIGLESFHNVSSYGFTKNDLIDAMKAANSANLAEIEDYGKMLSDCYVLFYQQFIGDLPVNDVHRTNKARHEGDPLETYAVVIISQTGIETMYVYSAYDVIDVEACETEYEWEDALDAVESQLSKGLKYTPFQFEKIEKILYATGKTNTSIILRPVWYITVTTSDQKNRHFVIDTITLEIYD